MSVYKCLLVGDGGTGKTSLIKRLVTGEFSTSYSATVGYEVHHLVIYSEALAAKVNLQVWDVSGQTSSGQLLQEILSSAHCAIIVFDVTSRITFNNVAIWYREIVQACGPSIPIVIIGNKIDMPARKIKTEAMLRKFSNSIKYYDISVKTRFNIEQPILWIATQLLQSSDTQITSKPFASQSVPVELKVWGEKSRHKNEVVLQDSKDILMPSPEGEDESNTDKHIEAQSRRLTRRKAQKSSNGSVNNSISKKQSNPKRTNDEQSKR